MTKVPAGRTLDWSGGSLDELLSILAEPALSARVEARKHDGIGERVVGEVHVVAGGFADAYSGSERGDAALNKLKQMSDLKFRVEPRLPHPVTGNLSPPGLEEGALAERPLADLMRYCEDFVLTCTVEVWHADESARVSYRRGELVKAIVNGSEASDKLPEVMAWAMGHYRFVLPQLVLPSMTGATQEMGAIWEQPSASSPAAPPVAAAAAKPEPPPRATIPFLPSDEPAVARGTRSGMQVDVFDPPQPVRSTDLGLPAAPNPPPQQQAKQPAVLTTQPTASFKKPESRAADTLQEIPGSPRTTAPGYASSNRPAVEEPKRAKPAAPVEEPSVKRAKPAAPVEEPSAKRARPVVAVEEPSAKRPRPAPEEPSAKRARPAPEEPSEKRKRASGQMTASTSSKGMTARPAKKSVYDLPLGVHMGLGLLLGAVVVATYWLLQRFGILPPGQ